MKKSILLSLFAFVFHGFFADVLAQPVKTPEDFMRIYQAEIKKIKLPSDGKDLGLKAAKGIGIADDLKEFIQVIPGSNRYEPVIQYIKLQTQINRGPLTATYTKVVSEYGRHKAADQLNIIGNILTNLGRAASVYTILEAVDRHNAGDIHANSEAMEATYALVSAELLRQFGLSHLTLVAKPIDFALRTFMSVALRSNERIVFDAYTDFLDNKYSKDSWWQLYKTKNHTLFNHRLVNEFWGDSDRYVAEYMQRNGIRRNSGAIIDRTGRLANTNTKNKFAGNYYANNVNNYVVLKSREALIRDKMMMEGIMIGELVKARQQKERSAELKAALERFEKEMNEKKEFEPGDVDFIKIIPRDVILQKGETVEILVRAYLKNGESTFITDRCELPTIDFDRPGEKQVVVSWEGHEDETTWSVEVEPELEIVPEEYRFDINDSEKDVNFVVNFSNKYEIVSDVTSEAFDVMLVHPNEEEYENAKEYPIYARYEHDGTRYIDEAIVVVSGCEDPDKKLDESSGECKCDTERGFFENEDEECSKYVGIYLNPKTIKGAVGEAYSIEVVGFDDAGNEKVIHKLKVVVESEGRNVYNMSYGGYYEKYTVIGLECSTDRMEPDERGNCKCKPEFIPVDDNCLTLDEIEQQARADGAGEDVDCEALVRGVHKLHNDNAPSVTSKVAVFIDHAELALKLLNDRSSDPCNNAAFANSMDITKKENENLEALGQKLRGGMATLWGNGGYQCGEMIDAESELIDPILEEMIDVQDIQGLLEAKWLEYNCKQEDIDDLTPDLTHDPNRNPSGNVSGASGSDFPSGGPGGGSDVIGEENTVFVDCLAGKGYTTTSLESRYMELATDFQIAASAYGNNPDNPTLCYEYKRVLTEYRDLNQLLVDCWIAADIQNYPNGQQALDSSRQAIAQWNSIINSLPC